MNKDLWAVCIGDHFSFLSDDEIKDISLEHRGTIRLDGQNWNYFQGIHASDSEKIADLLVQHEVYSVKEHLIHPVQMRGTLEIVLPGFEKNKDSLSFGAYLFVCDGKEIPIDFGGMSWDIGMDGEKMIVSFASGETPFGKDYFLEDFYEEDYQAAGLRINDITAEFLSHATSISEFMVGVDMKTGKQWEELGPEDISKRGSYVLKELCFSDREQDYPVRQEVLEAFNYELAQNSQKKGIDLESAIQAAKQGKEIMEAGRDSTRSSIGKER